MPKSPQAHIYDALGAVLAEQAARGVTRLERGAVSALLLARPDVAALAAQRCRGKRVHNTPTKWVGNQYDFFTGRNWGTTPQHAGLQKVREGGTWSLVLTGLSPQPLSSSGSSTMTTTEVARVMVWYAEATAASDSFAAEFVDAAAILELAPSTWRSFIDEAPEGALTEVTNSFFAAWCGDLLTHMVAAHAGDVL